MSEEDIVDIIPEAPPNPPAFARPGFAPEGVRSEDCGITDEQDGMSLRDFFAAVIAGGLLSTGKLPTVEMLADRSFAYAYAMLAARAK